MKHVTYIVEIVCSVNDNVNPNEVEIRFDCGAHPPYDAVTGDQVGNTHDFQVVSIRDNG